MTSPIEHLSNLVVGTVESVSPDDIRILLDLDAPHSTALNNGTPTAFPRLNGYVLIPNEAGATVAYIAWIGIERSPYPKRSGLKDFGLIDLPFPLRKMSVTPVGTLTSLRDRKSGANQYELSRGVMAFPSVGDQVLMPTSPQIDAIVGGKDKDKRLRIGSSITGANTPISVDPDKLFGRHLAVLGNTGSGKSCSVAGLIRWSIGSAERKIGNAATPPNMRFILLDPNGEYSSAFADMPTKARVFRPGNAENPFVLPAWMWNGHEWSAVTSAQPGAQRPLLLQALRNLKAGRALREPIEVSIVRQTKLFQTRTLTFIADGTGTSYSSYAPRIECFNVFKNLSVVMQDFKSRMHATDVVYPHLEALADMASTFHAFYVKPQIDGRVFYTTPNVVDFRRFLPLFDAVLAVFPKATIEQDAQEDAPCAFDVSQIAEHIEALAADTSSNVSIANFISTLTLRIRSMLADKRLAPVIAPDQPPTFEKWLTDILGDDSSHNGQVAIIDLSLVPSDVVHVVVAVLARLVFEASQRYRKRHPQGKALPTTLVLEEAHTFVRHGINSEAGANSPAALCREAFERIAREGRKFGLGLVISSQRPSELSQTVLAQCNTFLLHRIVNDEDQRLVGRLVPDNVGGLLRELPSLPSKQAILLGWATPIPILVEIDELPEEHRPKSADPDFWDVWTLKSERTVNWKGIANEWSGIEVIDEKPLTTDSALDEV